MKENSKEIVNHIILLYDFIRSYFYKVQDKRRDLLPPIHFESKESYINIGIPQTSQNNKNPAVLQSIGKYC